MIHSFLPQTLALQSTVPMNYYTVFNHVSQLLPHDCIIISEGANTMDIGRTMLNNYLPRHRRARLTTAAFTGTRSRLLTPIIHRCICAVEWLRCASTLYSAVRRILLIFENVSDVLFSLSHRTSCPSHCSRLCSVI